jgi:hypothetical protein
LKVSANELKADLHDLYISAAKEIELDGGRKAIVIFVPFRQLKDFHKIQARLVRELEKKFRLVFYFSQCLIPYTIEMCKPPVLVLCISKNTNDEGSLFQ